MYTYNDNVPVLQKKKKIISIHIRYPRYVAIAKICDLISRKEGNGTY